jgi:hypothetical protein
MREVRERLDPADVGSTLARVNETVVGIYVGLVANLAAVALLNNPPGAAPSPGAGVWLVSVGFCNELVGVLMVASPELLPRIESAARWAGAASRSVGAKLVVFLHRLFRVARDVHVLLGAATGVATVGSLDVRGQVGPPAEATTEEKVAWLIERERLTQDKLQTIEKELRDLPGRWQADIDVARQELEGLSRELVRRVADARIRLRLLGLLYVVIGLVFSLAGNVV